MLCCDQVGQGYVFHTPTISILYDRCLYLWFSQYAYGLDDCKFIYFVLCVFLAAVISHNKCM